MKNNKHILSIIFITVILFIIIGFTASERQRVSLLESGVGRMLNPINRVLFWIGDSIEKSFNSIKTNTSLKEINSVLENRIIELQNENVILSEIIYKYEQQLIFEDFNKEFSFEYIRGTVIGRSNSNYFDKFTINIGYDNGVRINMPVVTGNGLVGLVTSVGGKWSTVTSIIEPGTRVNFVVRRTGDLGTLSGSIFSDLIGEVDFDSAIMFGDTLITSGLGSIYPKGIPVGQIKSLRATNQELTKSYYIEPFVNYKKIEYVYVLSNGVTYENGD